ncbi:hypothetical protein PIB30_088694 [Stylosanthes scabra]|uniref:Uncharacterized protein n=1 Tax=Stylosanthes scabra TaxID=79078 RepID=A0ABU6QUY8_9FABA|nr:hypothetical protein [Stylosanthes scabra]
MRRCLLMAKPTVGRRIAVAEVAAGAAGGWGSYEIMRLGVAHIYPDTTYPGSGRSNWRVIVKCKPRGRIESQEVVVQDEAYQSTEEIPVRVITETGIPETLRSSALDVDIIASAQLSNTENEKESEEDEGNSEDNGSASADSLSLQDDE